MGIAAILQLVTQLVPVATGLITTISGAKAGSTVVEVSDLIGDLAPNIATLVSTIETIRTQTEAQYPAVWEGIRTDWMETLAKWNNLQGG